MSLTAETVIGCMLTYFQYQVAKVTAEGVVISEPIQMETSWGFAEGLRGYGAQTQ